MRWYKEDPQLTYDDVLIVPQYSELDSRQDPNYLIEVKDSKVAPIIIANMQVTATPAMAIALNPLRIIVPTHRFQPMPKQYEEIKQITRAGCYTIAGSIGLLEPERTEMVLDTCSWIFLELAHADMIKTLNEIKYITRALKDKQTLVVGNVCTIGAANRLFGAGADIVKTGVGPGASCSTRIVTGCGYPQLSAVSRCSTTGRVIADGGIRHSGDIVKALAAGAQFVMIGSLFAGTDEARGQRIRGSGKKVFFGSASEENGRVGQKNTPEGVSTEVPYMGEATEVAEDLLKGLRQGMAMIGARNMAELQEKAEFIRITSSGVAEGTPHILTRF